MVPAVFLSGQGVGEGLSPGSLGTELAHPTCPMTQVGHPRPGQGM